MAAVRDGRKGDVGDLEAAAIALQVKLALSGLPRNRLKWRDGFIDWISRPGYTTIVTVPARTHSFYWVNFVDGGRFHPLYPNAKYWLVKNTNSMTWNQNYSGVVEIRYKAKAPATVSYVKS